MKIRRNQPDLIDADHLADMVRTPGYAQFQERQLLMRKQCVDALIAAANWENTRFLQGQICAIDRTLELPKIIRAEIAQRAAHIHKGKNEPEEKEERGGSSARNG